MSEIPAESARAARYVRGRLGGGKLKSGVEPRNTRNTRKRSFATQSRSGARARLEGSRAVLRARRSLAYERLRKDAKSGSLLSQCKSAAWHAVVSRGGRASGKLACPLTRRARVKPGSASPSQAGSRARHSRFSVVPRCHRRKRAPFRFRVFRGSSSLCPPWQRLRYEVPGVARAAYCPRDLAWSRAPAILRNLRDARATEEAVPCSAWPGETRTFREANTVRQDGKFGIGGTVTGVAAVQRGRKSNGLQAGMLVATSGPLPGWAAAPFAIGALEVAEASYDELGSLAA